MPWLQNNLPLDRIDCSKCLLNHSAEKLSSSSFFLPRLDLNVGPVSTKVDIFGAAGARWDKWLSIDQNGHSFRRHADKAFAQGPESVKCTPRFLQTI
jgi:hypothetical protein